MSVKCCKIILLRLNVVRRILSRCHLKVDGAVPVDVDLHDEGEQLVLGGVLAHRPHHTQQLLGRDRPTAILNLFRYTLKLMKKIVQND